MNNESNSESDWVLRVVEDQLDGFRHNLEQREDGLPTTGEKWSGSLNSLRKDVDDPLKLRNIDEELKLAEKYDQNCEAQARRFKNLRWN